MIIKCKMCGGDLNIQDDNSICACEFCGTTQTVPQIDNEKKTNLFNRANRLRTASYNEKKHEIELLIDESKKKTLELLNEELKGGSHNRGKGGLFGKKNVVAEQRKAEESTQDSLRRQLNEEEKKFLAGKQEMLVSEPDEKALIYSIASIYYKHGLFAQALEVYSEISDYEGVEELIANDPALREAAEKKNADG